MNDKEKETMEKLNITSETKTVFEFEGQKCARLEDAIKYAKIVNEKKGSVSSANK